MTQFYAYRGFSLRRASLSTRVLITCFFLTTAAAVAVGVINYRVRTGLVPAGAAAWYRGDQNAAGARGSGRAASGRLRSDAESQPRRAGPLYEKTPLELLDATHPHLFGQAFLFFVLCHLFALTPVAQRRKLVLYTATFASVLVDAASPWLIRYVAPGFGWLQVAGTIVMVACFLVLLAVPLKEMWFTRADAPEPASAEL